jgi:signal transduction protein with GAF and PtsI domain
MTTQVVLELPDQVYERAQHLAQLRQQAVAEVITEVLNDALPSDELDTEVEESSSADKALDREMQAYIAMHPRLKEKYLGQHVAVYNGRLIDHDKDFDLLYERVRKQYPDEIVWMSTVKTEPIETIYIRSPRFVQEDNH